MKVNERLKKIHYAWFVSIGCCLLFFYGVGLTTGTFAIFLPQLTKELNLTNTESSSILSVISTIGLFLMIVVGKISNKIGARRTILFGGISIALGNLIFSLANSLLHCYLGAILVGLGYGCCSTIIIVILLNRWFVKSKGTAIGIAFAGSGIAIIILTPILSNIIFNQGMRIAFITQSIIIFFISVLTFILIRDYPRDIGIEPYGKLLENDTLSNDKENFTFKLSKDTISKKYIIMILIALLLGVTVQPTVSHLPSFLISVGYDETIAMSVVSLYGLSMVFWKTFYGFIIDSLGGNKTNYIFFPVWIMTLIFSGIVYRNIIFVYIFLLIIGIGPAIATVSLPIWVVDIFHDGPANSITTTIQIITIAGSSLGMVLFGYLLDLTGSYNITFLLIILFSFIVFINISKLYNNNFKRSPEKQI